MTLLNRAALLGCLVLLVACDPVLKDATEHGGSVTNAAGMQGRKAFALARAHCRQYGRDAKISEDRDMMADILTFDCVE